MKKLRLFIIFIIAIMILTPNANAKTAEEEKKANLGGCSGYNYESSCEHNKFYSCIWNRVEYNNKTYTYCNTDELNYVKCGDAFDIPNQAPAIISLAVDLLKIATPIILIIVSIIALLKAVSASNEDEIKKAQKGLIRKMIAAAMVFFIVTIVQFVIMKVADSSETGSLSSCLSCMLNNDCEKNIYYKTNVFGKYECRYVTNGNLFTCPENE